MIKSIKEGFPLKFRGNLSEHKLLTNQDNKKGGICEKHRKTRL